MQTIEIIAQDLFDKVRSRFKNLEMGDSSGSIVQDPKKARFFDFDFVIEGNNLGRVSISINEPRTLKLFYGQGILDDVDKTTEQFWYDFVSEMRFFAKRRVLRFDVRDITKKNLDKEDFKFLAKSNNNVEESKSFAGKESRNFSMNKNIAIPENKMYGSSKSSYRLLEKTKLIIRHSKAVDEGIPGSRSRHINAIYVENEQGERWKCPINSLSLGEAMQRHVANGGRPYDPLGLEIVKTAENIAQLNAFKKNARHVVNDSMHTGANEIMERVGQKLETLREWLKKISKQHHYENWAETFTPIQEQSHDLDQATMEDLKNKFTVTTFSEDLTQYFPLIHSIMKEAGTINLESYVEEENQEKEDDTKFVDEFYEYESWAKNLGESILSDDQREQLTNLLSNELTLGENGESAILALKDIGIDDTELFDALSSAGKLNADTDAVPTIISWLERVEPEFASSLSSRATPAVSQETPVANTESSDSKTKKVNTKEIAEMVFSFYNRTNKTFPLGETGVIEKIKNKLGDKAGVLAEKLVYSLSSRKNHELGQQDVENELEENSEEFEDIMKLSGIKSIST